jgi:hypothetical protein
MQIDIIGVPIDLGADRRGVDMGPSAIRYAHLRQKLEGLGYSVEDRGNVEVPIQETCSITDSRLKYIDCIIPMGRRIAGAVATSIQGNRFPLVLGGDHSLSVLDPWCGKTQEVGHYLGGCPCRFQHCRNNSIREYSWHASRGIMRTRRPAPGLVMG